MTILRTASHALVLIGSWYWMQIVHEAGHATLALITGGHVRAVHLGMFIFSRTDVEPNPHPLAVAWGGPIIGTLLPLACWSVARSLGAPVAGLVGFFAGFCAVANGAYTGVGSIDRIGDTGDIASAGSPRFALWMFGATAATAGLLIWHRLGTPRTPGKSPYDRSHFTASLVFAELAVFVVLVV